MPGTTRHSRRLPPVGISSRTSPSAMFTTRRSIYVLKAHALDPRAAGQLRGGSRVGRCNKHALPMQLLSSIYINIRNHTLLSAMYPRSLTLPPVRPRPFSPVFLSLARTLIPQPPPPLVSSRPLPTTFKKVSPQSESNRLFMEGLIREIETLRAQAKEGGGQKVLDRWKAKGTGKLSVRER